jgi:hypothetical protein
LPGALVPWPLVSEFANAVEQSTSAETIASERAAIRFTSLPPNLALDSREADFPPLKT